VKPPTALASSRALASDRREAEPTEGWSERGPADARDEARDVAQVWGYAEGTKEWRLEATLSGHSDWVRDAAWAPNVGLPMSTIASCGQDGKVLVWTQSVRSQPPRHVPRVSRGARTKGPTLGTPSVGVKKLSPLVSL